MFSHNINDSLKEVLRDIEEINEKFEILIPIKKESEKIKPEQYIIN